MQKLTLLLVLTLITLVSTVSYVHASTHDYALDTTYNIRFTGEFGLSSGGVLFRDVNNDGRGDLLIGNFASSYNGRQQSGSLYIIDHDLFSEISGTGNVIDLTNPSNFTIRIDGAEAYHSLTGEVEGGFEVADINGNSLNDIIVVAGDADYNTRSQSGSAYILYDSKLAGYTGTGNVIDLASSANYNIRLDGSMATEHLGTYNVILEDIIGDSRLELLLSHTGDHNGRGNSGGFYVFETKLLDSYIGTGNTVDMATASNYSIRFDGPLGDLYLSYTGLLAQDINNNGKEDLLFSSDRTDYNTRTDSGSAFIVFDELFLGLTGTGNTVDLANPANYSIRYDGAVAGDALGSNFSYNVCDVDHDSAVDLIIGAVGADNNARADSGSLYIINNTLVITHTGTGNIVDLLDSNAYTVRVDGAGAGEYLGTYGTACADYDYNGKKDLVMSGAWLKRSYVMFDSHISELAGTGTTLDLATALNYNVLHVGANNFFGKGARLYDLNDDGRLDLLYGEGGMPNGSLYVMFNFPHTINIVGLDSPVRDTTPSFSGTIQATNSTTSIAGVEYSINGTWRACAPADGAFNSTTENFRCEVESALTEGTHTVMVRAYDIDHVFTSSEDLARKAFSIDTSVTESIPENQVLSELTQNTATDNSPELYEDEEISIRISPPSVGTDTNSTAASAEQAALQDSRESRYLIRFAVIALGALGIIGAVSVIFRYTMRDRE